MLSLIRFVCFFFFISIISSSSIGIAQEAKKAAQQPGSSPSPETQLSVEELNALLNSIDPYLPQQEVSGEIDIFGSTSMDVLAHRWSTGFKEFHSNVKVVISAEGSESVFDRLARNHSSIGMLSRPVTNEDLAILKTKGLKKPVAIQVAREALGVFVNESNPLEVITYPQLVTLFCAENPDADVNWSAAGVTGEIAEKPVHVVGRNQSSGTRTFIETYLFHQHSMRSYKSELPSNAEVLRKVEQDPQAIAISEYKFSSDSLRRLKLRVKNTVIEGNEHDMLMGRYPITRPLTLVFDLEAEGTAPLQIANLFGTPIAQAGQSSAILAGFFPFDPPTLLAESSKMETSSDN